jgi:hypothetical protein
MACDSIGQLCVRTPGRRPLTRALSRRERGREGFRDLSARRSSLGGPGLDIGVARAFFPEDDLLLYHGMRPMAAPHVRGVPENDRTVSIT